MVPVPWGLSTHWHPNPVLPTACGQGTLFWCFSNAMIKIEQYSILLKFRELNQVHTRLPLHNSTLQSRAGSLGWTQQPWAHFGVGSRQAPPKTQVSWKRAAPSPPTFSSPVDSCPAKASASSFFITQTWLHPHFTFPLLQEHTFLYQGQEATVYDSVVCVDLLPPQVV